MAATAALPFTFVLLMMCRTLWRALAAEPGERRMKEFLEEYARREREEA